MAAFESEAREADKSLVGSQDLPGGLFGGVETGEEEVESGAPWKCGAVGPSIVLCDVGVASGETHQPVDDCANKRSRS